MISGSKIRIDRWCRVLLVALACSASSAWALSLPELMGQLGKQKSGEARFNEQRFVRGLEGPLDSAGTLSFTAPDKLARRTLTPRPESMVVDGNTLTLTRGSRTRTMALDSMPELIGLVEAMRSTLSGDTATLQRYFRSTVSGTPDRWTLDLLPLDDRLAAQLRSVRMSGRNGDVLGIEMEFIGGDRSVMTIMPTAPSRGRAVNVRPDAAGASGPGRSRRLVVMLVWLLAMAAGVAWIARSQFSADLSAFLPQSPDARQRVLIDQLQSGVASRTILIGIEGGTDAAQRATVSRALAGAMRSSGMFDQVQNGDAADWTAAGTWIFEHRYALSPAVGPERFTVDGLRDAIVDTLSLLGTPAGNMVKPLLDRDPTGETQRIAEGLIPATAPRTEEGVWASRTAPRAMLLATTKSAGSDLDTLAAAIARIQSAYDTATQNMGAAAPRLLMSGSPVFSVQSRDQIKGEVTHLATVGGIVMGGLLLLAFASPRALVLAFLPVATGIVGGTACVSLVFGSVHGLTLGFGSTLIGETVDYAIYYLIQARGAAVPGTGWQRWRDLNWPTVRLGLLTSVCGFAALLFSGFPGLAQLGVFSIAGLVTAAFATRYVLPVLAPDGASGMGLRRHMARAAGSIVRGLPRLRLPLFALGVAALALVLWQGAHLWRANLSAMSPVPKAAQLMDEQLRADIGASDASTLVVVQGADIETVLRNTEAAGARLDKLVDSGDLAGFETVTRFLPSEAAQKARLASLPDAATLRTRLAEATAGTPLPASRLTPFIDDVEKARTQPVVRHAELSAGPLGPVINALMYQRSGGGWGALIALHPGATFDAARLEQALAGVPDVQVVDVGRELGSLYDRYLHEAFLQVLLGALAVVVLLAVYLRSGRRLLAVCQPLVFAVVLTLGGLAVLQAALGILHLVGLLLVVAVGSNYALFFDQLRETGRADEDTLASLMLANLTTVVSFGLIAISDIPALSSIGRVVAPGALLALLLSAAFARGAVTPRTTPASAA